jgi:hypothetical protein
MNQHDVRASKLIRLLVGSGFTAENTIPQFFLSPCFCWSAEGAIFDACGKIKIISV